MATSILDAHRLREILHYDPQTGAFRWKVMLAHRRKPGDVVMQQAGWQAPTPAGQDPNYPIPEQAVPVEQPGGMPGDTSPTTPANPMQPMSASEGSEEGIETLRAD